MIELPIELYSSKNHKQIFYKKNTKKPFISKSNIAMKSQDDIMKILPLYRRQFVKMLKGKEKPYHIWFKIYRKTKGRFDYVNIIQLLLDCMVKDNWLDDDNANEIIPVFEPYEVDNKNPRVIIGVK